MRWNTAGAQGPEFDGSGALLDAVVEMRRFDQNALETCEPRASDTNAQVLEDQLVRSINDRLANHFNARLARRQP